MKNPWRKLSGKVIYQDPWMGLLKDRVIKPGGSKGFYAYVNKAPGVVIIALTQKKEIYLVGQWRYPVGKYSWELPMGAADKEKGVLAAAKRELAEEAKVGARDWKKVGMFYFANGSSNQAAHIYVARKLYEKHAQHDDSEELAVKKVPLKKFERMIQAGGITDGPTIAAYYRAKLYFRL